MHPTTQKGQEDTGTVHSLWPWHKHVTNLTGTRQGIQRDGPKGVQRISEGTTGACQHIPPQQHHMLVGDHKMSASSRPRSRNAPSIQRSKEKYRSHLQTAEEPPNTGNLSQPLWVINRLPHNYIQYFISTSRGWLTSNWNKPHLLLVQFCCVQVCCPRIRSVKIILKFT